MVEVMETTATSFQRSRAHPQPCRRPLLTHASSRDAWTLIGKSGSVSCGVAAPFSWVLLCTRFCLGLARVYFPVLCKFWQLYGGANGDLLQESLCHTQVYCTQSPCPCSSPVLTCTSSGDTQTQFYLSLCGISGSWCTQGLFEPSEPLWRVWGLILNAFLPLLPSFWSFSFALGPGVSPQSHSSTMQPPLQHHIDATQVPHSRSSRMFKLPHNSTYCTC